MRPGLDRLNEKFAVDPSSGCWVWRGSFGHDGYGRFYFNRAWSLAHRVAYELIVGPIPAGLTIDHLCRNRACVNPEHLEPVTNRENCLRGESFSARNARKTHCPQGHEYSAENTVLLPQGSRGCRSCRNEASNRYKARRKAVA